jgi:hypothetical protein
VRRVVVATVASLAALGLGAVGVANADERSSKRQDLVQIEVTVKNDSEAANITACAFTSSAGQCTNGGVDAGASQVIKAIGKPGEKAKLDIRVSGTGADGGSARKSISLDDGAKTVTVSGDADKLRVR